MEHWRDQGIILGVRPHGENGGIVSLLTEHYGRQSGYIRGIHSAKIRGVIQIGNTVDIDWSSRIAEQLGSVKLDLISTSLSYLLDDRARLMALQSACALCDSGLPEREGHPGLFYGLKTLMEQLRTDIWVEATIIWELAFLKELGFPLELTRCAGGGDPAQLAYVSPKTGRAVSLEHGQLYKEKLLRLPVFLGGFAPEEYWTEADDLHAGFKLTGYFLEHRAYAHHTRGLPEARVSLERLVQEKLSTAA